MPIDPCQCPSTIEGLLKAIYCTLYDIAENGAVVSLENISGISAFWKSTLGGTPAADQVFGTDGAGVFTTFDVTDAGINILAFTNPADVLVRFNSDGSLQAMDEPGTATWIAEGDPGITDPTGAAPFAVVNGIVTAVS